MHQRIEWFLSQEQTMAIATPIDTSIDIFIVKNGWILCGYQPGYDPVTSLLRAAAIPKV
jgi:hypothetical protein